MIAGEVKGIQEFRDFADSVDDVADNMDSVVHRAVKMTAHDFIERVVELYQKGSTAKGGTLDSRTSPYSPGGTNDSSSDNLHLASRTAWKVQNLGEGAAIVSPRDAVEDRAKWIEYGTKEHGPSADTPMYFNVGGTRIVVADKPDKDSPFYGPYIEQAATGDEIGAQFVFGETGTVEGVPEKHIFTRAAMILERNNTFADNLESALKAEMAKEFGG